MRSRVSSWRPSRIDWEAMGSRKHSITPMNSRRADAAASRSSPGFSAWPISIMPRMVSASKKATSNGQQRCRHHRDGAQHAIRPHHAPQRQARGARAAP